MCMVNSVESFNTCMHGAHWPKEPSKPVITTPEHLRMTHIDSVFVGAEPYPEQRPKADRHICMWGKIALDRITHDP